MHTCYACGYPMDEWEGDIDGNPAHKDCIEDMIAPHYHLWLFADNGYNVGRNGATALFRRAPRFKSREQAMRYAAKIGRDREDAMAMKCECSTGVKGIVPKV